MELGNELFFWCGELIFARKREIFFVCFFFARKREKKWSVFFGVFLCFWGGVFVLWFCFVLFFARSANLFLS